MRSKSRKNSSNNVKELRSRCRFLILYLFIPPFDFNGNPIKKVFTEKIRPRMVSTTPYKIYIYAQSKKFKRKGVLNVKNFAFIVDYDKRLGRLALSAYATSQLDGFVLVIRIECHEKQTVHVEIVVV